MATLTRHRNDFGRPLSIVLRVSIIVLTLATAQIHASLGGLMFTLNALGYTALAAAMVLPGPFAQVRWLTRYGLVGFTAATIAGWLAFGARFELAYIDKAIEAALIAVLLAESWVVDGGPLAVSQRARRDLAGLFGR